MRTLFIGDIVGRPGRRAVASALQRIVGGEHFDLVVANCENAAAGFGVTRKIVDQLLAAGVDVLTSGNHIWDKKEVLKFIDGQPRLLRPDNYPDAPGSGVFVGRTGSAVPFAVINLQGRVHMPPIDCPFRHADRILARLDAGVRVRLIDFHAEVTSEKTAFGRYVDGRASAVVGTHTHVPTADECVLPGGTAYISDVGMSGPVNSVIGMRQDASLSRFLTGMPSRFRPAAGRVRLNAVVLELDEVTGRAISIRRRFEDFE